MACTYKLVWERYEEIQREYLDLVFNAEKHNCTVAIYDHGGVLLKDLQSRLIDLLNKSEELTPVTRKDIQGYIVSLLNRVNSDCCDAELFTTDPAVFINTSSR